MKYKIGSTIINSDQIVSVKFLPNNPKVTNDFDQCNITLTSTEPITNYDGDPIGGSASIVIELKHDEAANFWQVYSGDALDVLDDSAQLRDKAAQVENWK